MKTVRLGLLGGGTVGTGVARIIETHQEEIAQRLGANLQLTGALVSDLSKPRDPVLSALPLTTNGDELVVRGDVDIVVEVMGGTTDARLLVERALRTGKPVVTANKALLATHGEPLFQLAAETGLDLAFEASVGGGIPVIRSIREALASDRLTQITGILNGTSNYVLTQMTRGSSQIAEVIADAQRLGYAEADPSMDVDGIDAAQKLSILALLGFGLRVPFDSVPTTGLSSLEAVDFELAAQFGGTLKPLAIAVRNSEGLYCEVTPAWVPESSLLSHVNDAFNAVYMEGEALGPSLLYGRGAGSLPTAVSVVSDVIEVARNLLRGSDSPAPSFSFGSGHCTRAADAEMEQFVRLQVADEPGVLASVATALGQRGISVHQVIQFPVEWSEGAILGLTTHPCSRAGLLEALKELENPNGAVKKALALPALRSNA